MAVDASGNPNHSPDCLTEKVMNSNNKGLLSAGCSPFPAAPFCSAYASYRERGHCSRRQFLSLDRTCLITARRKPAALDTFWSLFHTSLSQMKEDTEKAGHCPQVTISRLADARQEANTSFSTQGERVWAYLSTSQPGKVSILKKVRHDFRHV